MTRQAIYWMLIAVAVAMMLARVARLDTDDPRSPTPFLSANDRSRWAMIRALGDDGTYVIDQVIFDMEGKRVRGWHTIDLVRHRGPDGEEHYYSSKPTLLPTLLAGEYWLIKKITGATLGEQPHYVARIMLLLTNVLPLAAAMFLLAQLIERWGTTDWGRVIAVAAACFGTFLTTFAVTLNNHTVAAVSLVVALAVSVPIFAGDSRAWWRFAVAGLGLGFMAANEIPALFLLVLGAAALAWKSPLRTLIALLPAVLLIAVGVFGTNYLAHGDWRTPYAHRNPGDNWYDYPGSYWMPENLRGIDRGEPSAAVYAFNVLVGHHGLFSLTPIWMLSAAGCWMWLRQGRTDVSPVPAKRVLAAATAMTTVVVVSFYLSRGQIDRNYGGGTCCLRWLMWLTPLWVVTLLPAADWMGRSAWGRALAIAFLAVGVFSASYAIVNPWSHPWIFDYWTSLGWIDYESSQ